MKALTTRKWGIGSFIALMALLYTLVNQSVLTPILQGVMFYGTTLAVVIDVLLIMAVVVGLVAILRSGDQTPISKKTAEEIALRHVRRGYQDGREHKIFSKLTQLEGTVWNVFGSFLDNGEQNFHVHINSQNGEIIVMDWV